MFSKRSIIIRPKNFYSDVIDNYQLIYSDQSKKGLSLLDKPSSYVFNLINNRRTVEDIFILATKKDNFVKIENILIILDNLYKSSLIYSKENPLPMSFDHLRLKTLTIWLHLTNQCNLRCKYCYIWKSNAKMSEKTAIRSIKKVINDAKNNAIPNVRIMFSGGECLLEFPLIKKIIEIGKVFAAEKNISISFLLLSNGILINDNIVKEIKNEKLNVGISLDGLKKEHDSQRVFRNGQGSYDLVMKGINNLMKNEIIPSITVVITKNNINNIPKLTKFFLKNQIKFKYRLFRPNAYAQKTLMASSDDLIKNIRAGCELIIKHQLSNKIDSINYNFLDNVIASGPVPFQCAMGHHYMVITHEGKIAPCPVTMTQIVGSIKDKNIIKTMREGNFIKPKGLSIDQIPECRTCVWKYLCRGGCPYVTERLKGTYMSKSPYCTVYKNLLPLLMKIEARRIINYRSNHSNN